MNLMRLVAHHINLLITTASNAAPEVVIETARANLKYTLEHLGPRVQHLCRTVCGMLTWAAVLLLRVSRLPSCSPDASSTASATRR